MILTSRNSPETSVTAKQLIGKGLAATANEPQLTVYIKDTTIFHSWCPCLLFITCCWAVCWSIWCLCEGSCSCGSSPGPPSAGAWSCGRAHGRTGPGLTPAGPSGRGPCTQIPGKKHLKTEERCIIHTWTTCLEVREVGMWREGCYAFKTTSGNLT